VKNRLTDLNDHLFAQLERLVDEKLAPDAVAAEVTRATAVVQLADTIVANAKLQLDACKLVAEHGEKFSKLLPMLGSGNGNGTNGTNGHEPLRAIAGGAKS
jgi:hypothetical protein